MITLFHHLFPFLHSYEKEKKKEKKEEFLK